MEIYDTVEDITLKVPSSGKTSSITVEQLGGDPDVYRTVVLSNYTTLSPPNTFSSLHSSPLVVTNSREVIFENECSDRRSSVVSVLEDEKL